MELLRKLYISGKLGGLEKPSYTKLMKVIERYHPIDPLTNKKFPFASRITVRQYPQKLLDIVGIFKCHKLYRLTRRFCVKICYVNHWKTKVTKPDSLKDMPSSSSGSSTSSMDEDVNESKGLSTCSLKLGDGASLYLQTIKTFMILFITLTILNIPVLTMYSNHTLNNNYSSFSKGFFKYFTLGNMGEH